MLYFRAVGLLATCIILLLFLGYQGASIASNIWLSEWTDDPILKDRSQSNSTAYQDKNMLYLGVYGGFGVAQGLYLFASIL